MKEKQKEKTSGSTNESSAATMYAKRIMFILRSMTKTKTILMAIKSKSEAVRARLLVLSSLRNVKKPSPLVSLSHKIHSLLPSHGHQDNTTTGRQDHHRHEQDHRAAANASSKGDLQYSRCCYEAYLDRGDDDGTLVIADRSLLFDDRRDNQEEDDRDELEQLVRQQGGDPNASVIDLVRNSKEEVGENFSLEAEIDHVADLFIMKFHKKMRMQKLDSFKRYQQMLERSAA